MTTSARDSSRAWFAAAMIREVFPSTSPTTRLSCAITQRSRLGLLNHASYWHTRFDGSLGNELRSPENTRSPENYASLLSRSHCSATLLEDAAAARPIFIPPDAPPVRAAKPSNSEARGFVTEL